MFKLAVFIGLVAVVASALVGGFKKVDNLEDVQKLAQWSTSHPSVKGLLNFEDATVAQVVEAQRQLVNGLNYRIKFNVIGRNQDNKYAAKQCYLEMYVSFADERQVKSVNCADNLEFFGAQPYAGQEVEGGEETYQLQTDLAKWAIDEHKKLSVNQFNAPDADLMQVKKFTRQVVSGMKYRLTFTVLARRADNKYQSQECRAEIWDRPWLNLRELQSINCQDTNEITPVEYESENIAGGEQVVNDYSEAQEVAAWAVRDHISSAKSNEFASQQVRLLRVPKMTRQVVAGLIYRGQMVVLSSLEDNKYQSKACDFQVWERKWLSPQRELVSMNCQDTNEIAPPPSAYTDDVQTGGFQKMADNQKSQELANWIAEQQETKQALGDDVQRVIVLQVEPAESQVVAGINYRFKVDILIQSNSQPPKYTFQRCSVVVHERAWENVRQVTSYLCENITP
jgi:hypothetical protein